MKNLKKLRDQYLKLIKNSFDFNKFNEFSIVHHSNSIEGSTLTKAETFLLLEESLTPKNKPIEQSLMALDHLVALKYVVSLAESKTRLSVDVIKHISSLIMKNTGSKISAMAGDFDSSKGDFRKNTVFAGTTTFMDYKKVPDRIELLVDEINTRIDDVNGFEEINNLAFDSHFQIVSIHPFADGNGRISRLLMNYIQHYHKEPLTVVFKEDKQEYFNSLNTTRKEENINVFRKFMFQQAGKFYLEQINSLTKKPIEKKGKGKGLSFIF